MPLSYSLPLPMLLIIELKYLTRHQLTILMMIRSYCVFSSLHWNQCMTYYKLVPARNVWTSIVKRKTKAIKYMFFYWIKDQGTGDDVACKIRDLDAYTKTILISAYELEKEVI